MKPFTVVCPIHNEEAILPQTLPSIYALNPEEVIFSLDRCTDRSPELVESEAEKHPETRTRTKLYGEEDGEGWGFRSAYLRREAYKLAGNEVILNTSADLSPSPEVSRYINLVPNDYGLISFGYLERWNPQCFIRIIISTLTRRGFSGLLIVSRSAWLESEDLEDLRRFTSGEDTHLYQAIKARYPVKHVNTRSIHHRPNESKIDHYYRGAENWQHTHRRGVAKAFLHSVVLLRPAYLTGYLHARRGLVD